jgi:S1-C subfamily serine protease
VTALDIALTVFLVLAAAAGWSQGLVAGVSTVIGFVAGAVAGRLLGPVLAGFLLERDIVAEAGAANAASLLPLVLGVGLAVGGGWVGTTLRSGLGEGLGRRADALGGALTGALAFVLVVWLVAGWVRTTPLVGPNAAVAESRIIAALDRVAPVSSAEAVGAIAQALAASGFPQVFSGEENIRSVGEPDPAMVEVGREVEDSTVKVTTTATRCSALQSGSGWVFEDDLVMTNAHVVAGSTNRIVQVGGAGRPYVAELVLLDPARDIAVLRVRDLDAEPLDLGERLGTDDDAVVVGYPENGPYTISPARVREAVTARGLDIYDESEVVREVYALRAVVRSGNSGGPVLDAQGRAVGLVFARSGEDDETGYALTLAELDEALQVGASAAPVASGGCSTTG